MCVLYKYVIILYNSVLNVRVHFSRLLIGAPEAQTNQPGVEKGGAVFKCGTTREDDCEEVPFDMRGEFSHAAAGRRSRASVK